VGRAAYLELALTSLAACWLLLRHLTVGARSASPAQSG
jgi:hypothetical protein